METDTTAHIHLMVEHLGLARLGLRDQGFIQHVKHVLADLLKFRLDLLTVFTDGGNMLVRSLGFFLLLDRRDDPPGRTTGSDHVLVGDGQEITLVHTEFAAELTTNHRPSAPSHLHTDVPRNGDSASSDHARHPTGVDLRTYLGHFLLSQSASSTPSRARDRAAVKAY